MGSQVPRPTCCQAGTLFRGWVVKPELEGQEGGAGAFVELGLELDPVKSEGVEEGGQALHQYWESKN